MEKKILVAVDDSLQATKVVDYVTLMDRSITPISFTLFHVQPALSQYLTEEARHKERARRALEKTMADNDAKAQEILNSAAQRMIRKGIAPERIEKATMPMNIGVANDILATGKAKYYDAIVVARRGVSSLQKWFMGSVTANLVEHTDLIPVWVVDGTVISDKILLAVDGSSSSLRALDHATFMLAGHPTPDLKILHVRPRLQGYCDLDMANETASDAETLLISEDQNCMKDFREQSMVIAEKNGFPKNHLHWETIDGKLSVAHAILNHTAQTGYGTVVMGRRGRSKSMFTGSVSRRLLHKAEEAALWLVP